jgi:basic membrane protein A
MKMKKLPFVIAAMVITALLTPACTGSSPDCTQENVVCVGLVTAVGKVNDRAINQASWDAVQQAKTDGLADWIRYIETVDPRDYDKNIQTFAAAGYDIIVTVGYDQGAPSVAEADVFPKILFIGVDQPIMDFISEGDTTPANYVGVVFPEDQAGFLAGALAAMMSQTHKIGAVCGTDSNAPIWRYGEGYRAGAAYIEGQTGTATEVSVVYHNEVTFDQSVTDSSWGADAANSLIDQGADVIFGSGGETGDGALGAAAARGVFAIGSNADQYFLSPETSSRMLSSAFKLVQPAVYNLLQAAVNGDFPGGGNYTGVAGYAPFHDLDDQVPEAVRTEMDQIFNGLMTGAITTGVPPEKPAE